MWWGLHICIFNHFFILWIFLQTSDWITFFCVGKAQTTRKIIASMQQCFDFLFLNVLSFLLSFTMLHHMSRRAVYGCGKSTCFGASRNGHRTFASAGPDTPNKVRGSPSTISSKPPKKNWILCIYEDCDSLNNHRRPNFKPSPQQWLTEALQVNFFWGAWPPEVSPQSKCRFWNPIKWLAWISETNDFFHHALLPLFELTDGFWSISSNRSKIESAFFLVMVFVVL